MIQLTFSLLVCSLNFSWILCIYLLLVDRVESLYVLAPSHFPVFYKSVIFSKIDLINTWRFYDSNFGETRLCTEFN